MTPEDETWLRRRGETLAAYIIRWTIGSYSLTVEAKTIHGIAKYRAGLCKPEEHPGYKWSKNIKRRIRRLFGIPQTVPDKVLFPAGIIDKIKRWAQMFGAIAIRYDLNEKKFIIRLAGFPTLRFAHGRLGACLDLPYD